MTACHRCTATALQCSSSQGGLPCCLCRHVIHSSYRHALNAAPFLVLPCSEPTSGLDSRAASVVMRAVRNITTTGRTVVCTIHQPSLAVFNVRCWLFVRLFVNFLSKGLPCCKLAGDSLSQS